MPVFVRRHDPALDYIRPYEFHGVHLSPSTAGQVVGDCPFCGREGKFSVEIETTRFKCWVCGVGNDRGGGNGLEFTRLIHRTAVNSTPAAFLADVASDRRLLSPDTVAAWGVARACDGTWLVPGYSPEGRLDQVYRRTPDPKGGWNLLPTPVIWQEGKSHALHLPAGDFDPTRENMYICEGPWDGMALWEVMRGSKYAPCQVVAVPGCNVWRDEWTHFLKGKVVTLMYDSDHPKEHTPGRISRAGYDGMARVARRLSGVAATVKYVNWGPEGFDPDRPNGWDVRDHLTNGV